MAGFAAKRDHIALAKPGLNILPVRRSTSTVGASIFASLHAHDVATRSQSPLDMWHIS